MSPTERSTLLIVLSIAVTAPVLADLVPRVRLPVVVLEIILGILVGPQMLGWAEPGPIIMTLSRFGMAFLFFVAGLEIDFRVIYGRPLAAAAVGWLLSLGLALALGMALVSTGVVESGIIVAGALTTTAIGTLIPIMRDAGEIDTRFGRFVLAAGAVAEFAPIVLISAVLTSGGHGTEDGNRLMAVLVLVGFTALVVVAAYLAARARPTYVVDLLQRKLNTSAQLPVRVAVLLLAALTLMTMRMGLDAVLGSLAAGIVVGLACDGHYGEVVRQKLEGIAFGFFVPLFFVVSGMRFDLHALTDSGAALVRLPMFLALFLFVRGLPALLYRRDLPRRDLLPLALLKATALPLVVAIAEIGVETQRLSAANAAAMVGAGMVSVLLFPLVALALRAAGTADVPSAHGPASVVSPVNPARVLAAPERSTP